MLKRLLLAGVVAFWSGTLLAAPCAGFNDVEDTDPFCVNVEWIKNRGITTGCAPGLYCPNDMVTRMQMAIFMNRLGNSLFPLNCADGSVMKWDGQIWACAPDEAGNSGGTVTSIVTSTGLQGSPSTITTTGTIAIAPGYRLPQACTNGQVPKSNGAGGWTCGTDSAGSGTVTNVGTGPGLLGGPITGTGTITLTPTQLLPTTACANGQIPKWNGTAWACAADNNTNSGGTVVSVATGSGLTGGPITTSGTINLAATQLLPPVACAAGQLTKWSGTEWICATDTSSGGTVTSVATGPGLAGGPITGAGTITLTPTQLLPQVACTNGQVAKWNGTAWACAADNSSAGTVTSVGTGTGLTGGPVTGTGTIALASGYQLPQGCTNGQVAKSNGAGGWTCQPDAQGGSGTVTNVATGPGLAGGPITGAGTITLTPTQLLPQVACASGQVAKWNGTAWACAADNDSNSGGTVTSVATGTGLTGGPVTGAGTIALASGYQLPQGCTNGQVAKSNGAGGWTCQADTGGSGTVTNVATGTGLTGGPITATGTIALAGGYQLPQGCANGQVPKSNGAGGWTCQADSGGSGTVTNVATGPGLTGGPITATGTIGLASTQLLPVAACSNGQVAKWNAGAWVCATDNDSNSGGTVTSVSAGTGLTGGPITTTGSLAVDVNYVQRRVSGSCPAGSSIRAIAGDGTVTCEVDDTSGTNAFVQGGNAFGAEAVLGTTDAQALDIRVNGSRVMRYEPNAISPNVIGGHPANFVTAGVRGATIAGGGVPFGETEPIYNFEGPNRVTDIYGSIGGGYGHLAGNDNPDVTDGAFATIGGGFTNTASGFAATVAGGDISTANGPFSAIGGGQNNLASNNAATVGGGGGNMATGAFTVAGGGRDNVVSGDYATLAGGQDGVAAGEYSFVGGGRLNRASGQYSFAGGRRAKTQTPGGSPTLHNGTFVWADSNDFDFHSTASNQVAMRATGGMRVVLGVDGGGNATWACEVVGGGSWACSSDRNLKQNLTQLDGQAILERLAAMPIYAWNPLGGNENTLHFGPTAQDFHAAFGLGDSNLRIGQQDADGVALAAIQGLNEKIMERERALRVELEAKSEEIRALREEIATLRSGREQELDDLRRAVHVLLERTSPEGRLAVSR